MDVVAENSAHVKKAWKIAWPVSNKKRKLAATAASVGEMPLEIQFEDDPEGERRITTKWHMPDHLTDYLNNEVCWPVRERERERERELNIHFSQYLDFSGY